MLQKLFMASAMAAALLAGKPAGAVSADAKQYARSSEYSGVKISPDGNRLATIVRVDGRLRLNIVDLATLKSLGAFGITGDRDIADFWWATNDRVLFGLSWSHGDNEKPVYTGDLEAINVDGSHYVTLLGRDPSSAFIISNQRSWQMVDLLRDDPNHILVSRYVVGGGPSPYLFTIDIRDGTLRQLDQGRNRFAEFVTDHRGNIRFQVGTERDGSQVLLSREADGTWKEVARSAPAGNGEGRMIPLDFDSSNRGVYYLDDRGEKRAGLYYLSPDKPEPELIFRDPDRDVAGLVPGSIEGKPIGVVLAGDKNPRIFFNESDPDTQQFKAIYQLFGGESSTVTSFSTDRKRAVFYGESDRDPGSYYVIDLAQHKGLTRLPRRSWVDPAQMSPMQSFTMQARDGLTLHGYLTQPLTPAPDGRKKMVVFVHGGPMNVEDSWGYDPDVQWLAHNGYAVLQVNYRGSSGYGEAFEQAGYGEWGRKMQDDVTDATHWAIDKGYADADAICIAGWSYGGYAALMGAVREPKLYRCAIGMSGVYDLAALRLHGISSETPEGRSFIKAAVSEDPKVMAELSPANRAAEIQVPVMLVHGGEDERTPPAQYDAMKDALQKAHKSVTLLYKKNEGHGFYSEDNRTELYEKMIQFLDANTQPTKTAGASH